MGTCQKRRKDFWSRRNGITIHRFKARRPSFAATLKGGKPHPLLSSRHFRRPLVGVIAFQSAKRGNHPPRRELRRADLGAQDYHSPIKCPPRLSMRSSAKGTGAVAQGPRWLKPLLVRGAVFMAAGNFAICRCQEERCLPLRVGSNICPMSGPYLAQTGWAIAGHRDVGRSAY